jgi:hypothetical protein
LFLVFVYFGVGAGVNEACLEQTKGLDQRAPSPRRKAWKIDGDVKCKKKRKTTRKNGREEEGGGGA